MAIDIFFLLLMIMAVIKGFSRGLIVAVFSFVAIIIGLAAAIKLSALVAGWLQGNTHLGAQWLPFISFALVMIAVIILVRLGARMIQKTAELMMLGWINRLGGIIFYTALYIMVFSIVLFYAEKMQLLKEEAFSNSKCYSFIQPWGPWTINGFGKLLPFFKDLFTQLETFFGSAAAHAK